MEVLVLDIYCSLGYDLGYEMYGTVESTVLYSLQYTYEQTWVYNLHFTLPTCIQTEHGYLYSPALQLL